ncbi:RNase III inhibitor [compost metagenome]
MIIATLRGSITKVPHVEYICNAANGVGPMGFGVAKAIRNDGGTSIQKEAFVVCSKANYQPGDVYVTNAGILPYKKVIHLVTMKNPGGPTSYEVVEQCLKTLVSLCKMKNIKRVALPALGTGSGKLKVDRVAQIFKDVLNSTEFTEFVIVDIDPMFIYQFDEVNK